LAYSLILLEIFKIVIMKVKKAVITAAGPDQRKLPVQTLRDHQGKERSVLELLIDEAILAGVDEVCVVVYPGDEVTYKRVLNRHTDRVVFKHQNKSLGYGHALSCASSFTGNDPFLHLVGDHLYVKRTDQNIAKHLVTTAEKHSCSVSTVQSTREGLITQYGTVGGTRIQGRNDLYHIDTVIEKPTPTLAEQKLIVPGLRAGHYLCFFGMHVLTGTIMKILKNQTSNSKGNNVGLSEALNVLASKEQYLALEKTDMRFNMGTKYGLMKAQLAIALSGNDRDRVMSELLEFFVMKDFRPNKI
jgi:UTP--glucose-1-phosphate uridylyltransferase